MNISVIGSEGYIGSSLVPELRRRGHDVRGFDSLLWDQPAPAYNFGRFRKVRASDATIGGWSDVIVYLAALAHDVEARIPRGMVMQANALEIERHIVNTWKVKPATRFVIPSSLSIFDKGSSAYPSSKRLLEARMVRLGLQHGIDILRFGTIFGVTSDTPPTSFRGHLLLNSMMLDAATDGIIKVNNPDLTRPVQSLKRAVMHLADRVEHPGGEIRNSFLGSATLHYFATAAQRVIPAIVRHVNLGMTPTDARDYALPPFIPSTAQAQNILHKELLALRAFTFRYQAVLLERRAEAFGRLYANLGLTK